MGLSVEFAIRNQWPRGKWRWENLLSQFRSSWLWQASLYLALLLKSQREKYKQPGDGFRSNQAGSIYDGKSWRRTWQIYWWKATSSKLWAILFIFLGTALSFNIPSSNLMTLLKAFWTSSFTFFLDKENFTIPMILIMK